MAPSRWERLYELALAAGIPDHLAVHIVNHAVYGADQGD